MLAYRPMGLSDIRSERLSFLGAEILENYLFFSSSLLFSTLIFPSIPGELVITEIRAESKLRSETCWDREFPPRLKPCLNRANRSQLPGGPTDPATWRKERKFHLGKLGGNRRTRRSDAVCQEVTFGGREQQKTGKKRNSKLHGRKRKP